MNAPVVPGSRWFPGGSRNHNASPPARWFLVPRPLGRGTSTTGGCGAPKPTTENGRWFRGTQGRGEGHP